MRYSCASLRADSLTQAVVDGLADSGQKRRLPLRQKRAVNDCGASSIRALAKSIYKMRPLYQQVWYQHMRLYIMIGCQRKPKILKQLWDLAERTQAHMASRL